jgi:hypothetical protein
LAKRVSADTITGITADPSNNGSTNPTPPAPSYDDLVTKIRTRLAKLTVAAEAALDAADPENERDVAGKTANLNQSRENQKTFEKMLKSVPDGFQLVPTYYSRITKEENEAIKQEYSFKVRPKFIKYLGDNHAAELKALGVPDAGIRRMKDGLDPVDGKGNLFSFSVDHIIERAGSGNMGKTKAVDPDMPGTEPVFKVNHIGNYILLTEKVHEFKNILNDLQDASDMPYGKGKWILMMAPMRTPENAGFVCPPQAPGSGLDGVGTHPQTLKHNEFVVGTTLADLEQFKNTGNMRQVVRGLIAQAGSKPVAEAAEAEAALKKPGALRRAFAGALAADPKASEIVENFIKPALADVTTSVTTLYDNIQSNIQTPKGRFDFWEFTRFFRSQQMKDLRADVEALPFEEASTLHAKFNKIAVSMNAMADKLDAEAKARKAADPRGANDNAARKPYRRDNNRGQNNGRSNGPRKPGQRFNG